jgi:hypothetical protein
MSPLVAAVVASVLLEGGAAIALDDGTIWWVGDRAWEELGACPDGEAVGLEVAGDLLVVECGEGSLWTWAADEGWQVAVGGTPEDPGRFGDGAGAPDEDDRVAWSDQAPAPRAPGGWPRLELGLRREHRTGEAPHLVAWLQARWSF